MEPIKALLLKHLRGQITPEEQRELDVWLAAAEANRELFAELNDPDRVAVSLDKLDRLHETQVWERLQAYGVKGGSAEDGGGLKDRRVIPVHRVHFLRRHWWAAAVIFVLLGTGIYMTLHNKPQKQVALTQDQRFKNDVAPGKSAAVLTLAGGQKIVLDSAVTGTINKQGNTTLVNRNGQLVYNTSGGKSAEILLNTLTTGRGNQYQLVLPDGSKVWLNAASSITYPATFAGGERKVTITGEVYFEIAKQQGLPFTVQNGELDVQVLGTHFNISAYEDEIALKTTLLEGSVKVVQREHGSILRPGQQAVLVRSNEQIKVVDDVNTGDVIAWKNGIFTFKDATIESVMRQMARWYDVEVVFDTKITQHFIADIPRDVPVSEVLKLLELTGQVHFKIEGKKITVIP